MSECILHCHLGSAALILAEWGNKMPPEQYLNSSHCIDRENSGVTFSTNVCGRAKMCPWPSKVE